MGSMREVVRMVINHSARNRGTTASNSSMVAALTASQRYLSGLG